MPMLLEAQHLGAAHGYHLQIAFRREQLREWLSERRADVAVCVDVVDAADELASWTAADHQQVLAIGPVERNPPEDVACAYWSDAEGIRAALQHLKELGHRDVAFLAGDHVSEKERVFDALTDSLDLQAFTVRSDQEHDMLAAGALMARRLLELRPRPTAVLARNDEFAIGALHALREARVRVRDELSIVGFNDISNAAYTYPSLTTVRTPLVECVPQLLPIALQEASAMGGEAHDPTVVSFRTALVVRSSTARFSRTSVT